MTGSPAVAEDIAQNCFLQLLQSPARYDSARGSIGAWLLGIARNLRRATTVGRMSGVAHDFSLADATIEISVQHLRAAGKVVYVSPGGGVSGEAVWIDVPGHGRLVFSLAARSDLGMQRAGEIRGTTMTWRARRSHPPPVSLLSYTVCI